MAIRTLVLHARHTDVYSYYEDWLEAFLAAGELQAEAIDLCAPGAAAGAWRTDEHDLVVLLHSTTADSLRWLMPWEAALAGRRRARVVVFVGNEYNAPRSHLGMTERLALLTRLRPDLIASQLLRETAARLYADVPGAQVASIPHALNPRRFRPGPPGDRRPIDLGVRSARYSPLLGDQDRIDIVRGFTERPLPIPLRLDLGLGGGRLGPDAWAAFLASCKGTVATEAGTSYLEKDDRTVNRIVDHLARRQPAILLHGLEKRFRHPWVRRRMTTVSQGLTALLLRRGWAPSADAIYERADPAELRERFFRHHPAPLDGKCISSRHFEAIGTKTCQIMFRGRFNDILEADRHYLSLDRDWKNLGDVLARFTDPTERDTIVDAAHELVMDAHTHQHRVRDVIRRVGAGLTPA